MIKNLFFYFLSLLLLSGCATPVINGPMFTKALNPPKADMGTLYVFRAKGGLGEEAYMSVKVNGVPFVNLAPMGYSYEYLTPGIYQLSIGNPAYGAIMTEIEIKPGQELYELFDAFGNSVVDVSPSKAPFILNEFRYIQAYQLDK